MKSMKFFATSAVAVTAVLALSSFVSRDVSALNNRMATDIHSHAHVQGKHCNGTVGCDCSGFSAITNGKEWQKSYCKRCGHHKRCHR